MPVQNKSVQKKVKNEEKRRKKKFEFKKRILEVYFITYSRADERGGDRDNKNIGTVPVQDYGCLVGVKKKRVKYMM